MLKCKLKEGGGKAVQSAVTGGAVTAEWRVASRRQDYTSTNSASKRSNIVSCDTFDLFEAVPNMKVSCSDGSASPHTSVTSNWTALPPNLHFDTSSCTFPIRPPARQGKHTHFSGTPGISRPPGNLPPRRI